MKQRTEARAALKWQEHMSSTAASMLNTSATEMREMETSNSAAEVRALREQVDAAVEPMAAEKRLQEEAAAPHTHSPQNHFVACKAL